MNEAWLPVGPSEASSSNVAYLSVILSPSYSLWALEDLSVRNRATTLSALGG